MGRVVKLRAGAREPQVGDRLAWDGMGWVPEVNIARPRGVTHVHTNTIVRVVMGPWRSPDFVSGSAGWQIDADGSAEFNDVTVRGTIYAEAGEIAGWTRAAGHLYAGSGANRVGLKPGTYPFYAGAEAEASAPFRVNTGGELWATNAHISGEITATTGTIGGWSITATEIKSGSAIVLDSSVPKIEVGTGGYIRSSNYVSGFDGFYIDEDFAEFGNVQVRGSLHCAVFVKDLISAHAGTLLVTKSAGKLIGDYTVGSAMQVETPPGGGWLFDNGDIVRLKEEYASGVQETWVTVSRAINTNEYGTVFQSGDSGIVYHKGATAVDYGASGDGGILQTADMANAPWLSVFTHAGAPWTTLTHHLRLGNLNGVGDYSSDKYGIFIGDYSGNKWMSYDPTNSLRIRGDAVIDGTIAATTFTTDIGALLFSQSDGLLLLGPNCEINDGEWWSLRKQKATITGAFHQEAGRWPGTRALVVERGTTNIVENPSFEVNVTDYWSTQNGTSTRITTDSRFGGACNKLVASAANNPYLWKPTAVANPAQGQKYTFSAWVKGSVPGGTIGDQARVSIREAGGAAGNEDSYAEITLTGQWQRVSVSRTIVEGDRTSLAVWVRLYCNSTAYGYIDGIQLENLGHATSYCDGSLGHDYSWSGTAHNSASTRVATVVATPTAGSIEAAEGYVAMWFKVPLLTDTSTQFLWSAGDVNAELDAYVHMNGSMVYRINGSTRCQSASGAVTVDVWHLAVFNWKVGTDVSELYIDGLLVDTGTCGGATPTLHTSLGVGTSVPTGSNYSILGPLGEFATGKTMLTAAKVAALYALQRPLVDMGAMDSPGIYILDGRFRMASSLTGNRIEMDAEEIAGYDSGGTKQFYLQASDGKAMCGAGAVTLDANGIRMVGTGLVDDPRRVLFQDDTSGARTLGWVGAGWGGGGSDPNITWLVATRDSGDPWPATAQVNIAAVDTVVGTDVRLVVNSNKTVEVYGEDIFKTEKLLRPGTGTADPTAKLEDGCLFYRTDTDKLRLRANGAWVDLN